MTIASVAKLKKSNLIHTMIWTGAEIARLSREIDEALEVMSCGNISHGRHLVEKVATELRLLTQTTR